MERIASNIARCGCPFTSQTKLAEEHKPTPLLAHKTRQKLTSIELTLHEVSDVLATLNKNKAQGPDNISLVMPMTDKVTVMIPCYHLHCNS